MAMALDSPSLDGRGRSSSMSSPFRRRLDDVRQQVESTISRLVAANNSALRRIAELETAHAKLKRQLTDEQVAQADVATQLYEAQCALLVANTQRDMARARVALLESRQLAELQQVVTTATSTSTSGGGLGGFPGSSNNLLSALQASSSAYEIRFQKHLEDHIKALQDVVDQQKIASAERRNRHQQILNLLNEQLHGLSIQLTSQIETRCALEQENVHLAAAVVEAGTQFAARSEMLSLVVMDAYAKAGRKNKETEAGATSPGAVSSTPAQARNPSSKWMSVTMTATPGTVVQGEDSEEDTPVAAAAKPEPNPPRVLDYDAELVGLIEASEAVPAKDSLSISNQAPSVSRASSPAVPTPAPRASVGVSTAAPSIPSTASSRSHQRTNTAGVPISVSVMVDNMALHQSNALASGPVTAPSVGDVPSTIAASTTNLGVEAASRRLATLYTLMKEMKTVLRESWKEEGTPSADVTSPTSPPIDGYGSDEDAGRGLITRSAKLLELLQDLSAVFGGGDAEMPQSNDPSPAPGAKAEELKSPENAGDLPNLGYRRPGSGNSMGERTRSSSMMAMPFGGFPGSFEARAAMAAPLNRPNFHAARRAARGLSPTDESGVLPNTPRPATVARDGASRPELTRSPSTLLNRRPRRGSAELEPVKVTPEQAEILLRNFGRAQEFFDRAMGQLWRQWFHVLHLSASICSGDGIGKVEHQKWVRDEAHTRCQNCRTKFGVTVWRHHCRCCGRLVCDTCSAKAFDLDSLGVPYVDNRLPLASTKGSSVRVCDSCYTVLKCVPEPTSA